MIPRPPVVEPGGPAPWEPLAPGAGTGITLASVLDALARAGRLLDDGPPAGPSPYLPPRLPRRPLPPPGPPSAVLVALFEEDGETRVILTRRAHTLRRHRDQVSLPGGRTDPGESALDAARREALEEIGLDPRLVTPVGYLSTAAAFSSGQPITSVVATLSRRPSLVANPAEVARVFDVSLAELVAAHWSERWHEPDAGTFEMPFFAVATETVWGATARMLVELLAVVLAR